jgi:hypothetical protein
MPVVFCLAEGCDRPTVSAFYFVGNVLCHGQNGVVEVGDVLKIVLDVVLSCALRSEHAAVGTGESQGIVPLLGGGHLLPWSNVMPSADPPPTSAQ